MRELAERWKAVAFAAVVFVSVVALFAAASALNPAPTPNLVRDVSVRIDGAGWVIAYRADSTMNRTAFSLLLEAADRLGLDVTYTRYAPPLDGVLVDSINGSSSGQGGLWWQYWVNGRYGDVGADRKVLSDGDAVLWAFRSYPPEGGA